MNQERMRKLVTRLGLEQLERMQKLVMELADIVGDEPHVVPVEREVRIEPFGGPVREALETMPASHGAVLDFENAADTAIAQFMLLETPVSIPGDFAGARAMFVQFASEAELVGRRANLGHCWRVRVVDNGEFRIWTTREGRIETVEYGQHER